MRRQRSRLSTRAILRPLIYSYRQPRPSRLRILLHIGGHATCPRGCSGNGRGREQGNTRYKAGVEAHAYDLALTDLAGTLGLATFGTGDRALPAEWTDDFITATTTPEALHYDEVNSPGDSLTFVTTKMWPTNRISFCSCRAATGQRDSSKPSPTPTGSTTTTRATTRGPAQRSRMRSTPPLPTGQYLTDGILALTAALTANPEAHASAASRHSSRAPK